MGDAHLSLWSESVFDINTSLGEGAIQPRRDKADAAATAGVSANSHVDIGRLMISSSSMDNDRGLTKPRRSRQLPPSTEEWDLLR